jgi:hypothetical protein
MLDVQSDWGTLILNLRLAGLERGPVGEEYAPTGAKKRERLMKFITISDEAVSSIHANGRTLFGEINQVVQEESRMTRSIPKRPACARPSACPPE